jgi:hypothetical protein
MSGKLPLRRTNRRSIMSINSALRISAAFIAAVVCFKVFDLGFDTRDLIVQIVAPRTLTQSAGSYYFIIVVVIIRYKPTAAARWASLFIIRATSITPSPLQSGHVFVPCGRLRKPSMWPDDHTREEIATASELAKRIYADAAIASVLHEQATSPGKASIA